jgi:cupin 2 domain-containing protein
MISVQNMFAAIPPGTAGEFAEDLLRRRALRIERIVSRGQVSPPDFWYDQEDDEWILLLAGSAALRFADGGLVALKPGDHLLIPRHCRHRVERTDPEGETHWLAVHFAAEIPA